jgi:uronate dehydrogenase
MNKKILITGGTGRIGTCIANGLLKRGGYDVLRGTRGEGNGKDLIHLQYNDLNAMTQACQGVHTIVHMGYYMRNDQFLEKHIGENTVNAYYLYEAARLAGVKRVIFGSSNHVFGFYQKGDPIDSNALYRPDSPYALSKVFVETIGRYYSDRYGISCFNVRIGNFATDGNPQPRDIRATYVWLSNEDCEQLFTKLIEYDESCKYLQMFGMSGNDGCYFDTSDNAVVGYVPKSNGAVFREQLRHAPGRVHGGIDSNSLTRHNFVGGYNNSMTIHGDFDLEYLAKISADYKEEP